MIKTLEQSVQYVVEHCDAFLQLWPHRYDFIWADYPEPGEKPHWQTESRYPLSDRLMLQNQVLYGVRFGPTTQYILLDIDWGSLYHPSQDPLAIARICSALEPLGLVEAITLTSSYSGGLHLYFPYENVQKTWEIALAVSTLLENAGFRPTPGHLELFPNPKPWMPQGEISLYQAHRLPLQQGSYLLNDEFQPIFSSQDRFVALWTRAQQRNEVEPEVLKQTLKSASRSHYRVTHKAEKFLNDLNIEIERGWTGPGMTNRLLGRITLRSYIFGHILYASSPLQGKSLVEDIIRVATALPGFLQWCRHQHEIEEKAVAWARAIEKSHYFPYGRHQTTAEPQSHSDQQQQWEAMRHQSREKIRLAIATLLNENRLPVKTGARFRVLAQEFQIGGKTLYKHKDLWHPEHLTTAAPVENPPAPPLLKETSGLPCLAADSPESSPSLLAAARCNSLPEGPISDSQPPDSAGSGCNHSQPRLGADLKSVLLALQARIRAKVQARQAQQRATQQTRQAQQKEAARQTLLQTMQGYLESGDPVLMSEALNWMHQYPEYRNELLDGETAG